MYESQEGVIMVVIYTRGFRDLISLCYAERSGYLLVVSSAENISPLGTGLTKQFNMTGDHSSLDEALERHRRNVRGYAMRE